MPQTGLYCDVAGQLRTQDRYCGDAVVVVVPCVGVGGTYCWETVDCLPFKFWQSRTYNYQNYNTTTMLKDSTQFKQTHRMQSIIAGTSFSLLIINLITDGYCSEFGPFVSFKLGAGHLCAVFDLSV